MTIENEDAFSAEIAEATKLLEIEEQKQEAAPMETVAETVEESTTEQQIEEVQAELQQTQEQLDTANDEAEKLPHGESSRLGRKVKRIEDNFDRLMNKLDELMKSSANPVRAADIVQPDPVEEVDPEALVTNTGDVLNLIQLADKRREHQSAVAKTQEEKARAEYFGRFESHRESDPDLHDAIYEEMLKNHNVKRTGQPDMDADFNYAMARNAILSNRLAEVSKPKPNVLGKPAPSVNAPGGNARTTARTIQLSPEEASLADSFGFKDEELQRILGAR